MAATPSENVSVHKTFEHLIKMLTTKTGKPSNGPSESECPIWKAIVESLVQNQLKELPENRVPEEYLKEFLSNPVPLLSEMAISNRKFKPRNTCVVTATLHRGGGGGGGGGGGCVGGSPQPGGFDIPPVSPDQILQSQKDAHERWCKNGGSQRLWSMVSPSDGPVAYSSEELLIGSSVGSSMGDNRVQDRVGTVGMAGSPISPSQGSLMNRTDLLKRIDVVRTDVAELRSYVTMM